mgnify:CR=1 FL=1
MIVADYFEQIVGRADDGAFIQAFVDVEGTWHIAVGHGVEKPERFWRPDDNPYSGNVVDTLNDPAPTLDDILTHIVRKVQ